MLSYSAKATINASPEKIWSILIDGPKYPDWDPTVIRIEGNIAKDSKIKAYSKLSPDRAFPVTVKVFEPNRKMVWGSGMPLGLFKGERTFTLTPKGDQTEFAMKEEFSGPMLMFIKGTIPDMNEPFNQFAQGLKSHAEK